jgi:hypothetical protein
VKAVIRTESGKNAVQQHSETEGEINATTGKVREKKERAVKTRKADSGKVGLTRRLTMRS